MSSLFDEKECENCKKIESDYNIVRIDHIKLQAEYEKLQKDIEIMKRDTSQNDGELRKNRQKFDQLQNELNKINEKYQKLYGEKERSDAMIKQLQAINQKIQQEKEEMLFAKPAENPEQNQALQQISLLHEQLRKAQNQKEQALSINTQLTLELQQLKSQQKPQQNIVQTVQFQRDSTTNEKVFQMEIQNLRQRINEMNIALQKQQQEYQNLQQESKQQIENLQQQLEQQDKNIDQQQSSTIQLKQLQAQLKKMEAQNKVLQKQLDYKTQRYNEQLDDINKLQEELNACKTNQIVKVLGDEEKDYKEKYKQVLHQKQELEQSFKEKESILMQKVQQYESHIKQKQGNAGLENVKLKEKLDELKELQGKLNQIQEEELTQKMINSNQKRQLDDLINSQYQYKQKVKQLESQLQQCEDKLIQSKYQIADMMNLAMELGMTQLLDKFASLQQ
ncbi:unnamed protein product [Paramecium octaurelia]|uniref:Uncharacterized protein n=1 Tax=Paramecium octaurelia TaxID=43137 RepID=A0A8S1WKM9_PAROT|nr:unnamed protein product [Paramecium octaurelia]